MRATALIQADLMVCRAAYSTSMVSPTMETTVSGGLLQGPVPPHGDGNWATTTSLCTDSATA